MGLDGRHVLVTGASTGIGRDLAVRLSREGATVGLVARRGELLDEVLAACHEHAPASRRWAVDLSDLDAAERVVDDALAAFGTLDALVNNAGTPKRRRVVDLAFDELEYTMRLNYLAPARMILRALPAMRESGGVIVNVASVAGRIGNPTEAAYSASKFALSGFSEAMATELHDTPVRVHLVQPGPIDTPIWDLPGEDAPVYEGDKYPPSLVSDAVVACLEGEAPFEQFVPEGFGQLAVSKAKDPDAWIRGAAEFAREAIHGG